MRRDRRERWNRRGDKGAAVLVGSRGCELIRGHLAPRVMCVELMMEIC